MNMPTFDPTASCPIIKNFECSQEDCGFWNADRAECIFWDLMAGKTDYDEFIATVGPNEIDGVLDLGKIYKDITIWVDGECTVRFGSVIASEVTFSATYGRVGTPVYFKGINARYLYFTSVPLVNILVTGNG
jgi:hypothetical protein